MSSSRVIRERYEVQETLALDPSREELRARDRLLGREVLLVRKLGGVAGDRALREARALAGLRHPGVQRLLDLFDDDGCATLVLEPAAGETLAARLGRDGRLAPDEVLRIGIEVAEALAAVHAMGAVHRDVSEENIVLGSDGSVCTAGFRLAKPIAPSGSTSLEYGPSADDGARRLDRSGLPSHPAPEQLGGEAANARTDLFALGCVLYRALTGRPAMPEILERGFVAPPSAESLAPTTPRALAQLVALCLARSPIGRPRSAAEVAASLRALRDKAAPRSRTPALKKPALALGGALALTAFALVGWQLWASRPNDAALRGFAVDDTVLASASPGRFAAGFNKARALLIGIGDAYAKNGFQPLANAVGDVEALDAALRALPRDGWETRLLLDDDATLVAIKNAMWELEQESETEDRVLVYFAGHGEPHPKSDSSGWIVPADGASITMDSGRTSWLSFTEFDRFMKDISAKHVLLAMDCCYGGRVATMRGGGSKEYEERFLTSPARVVLSAGRPDEQVSDGVASSRSPFAEAFLVLLSGSDAAFTSSRLLDHMQRTFIDRGLKQTPLLSHVEGVAAGEFVFLRE